MSEAAVARNALSFVLEHPFEAETRRALRAVLQAARPGPVQSFWELAAEAGHPNEVIRKRCTGLFLLFAWGNLVDDLADGDCDYIDDPQRKGPIVSFLLRCLADEYLLKEAQIPAQILARANYLFSVGAAHGLKEVQTEQWDAERWLEVSEGIAGMQYQAYMQILWHDTPLADICEEVGLKIGLVSSLYHDIQSEDPRYTSIDAQGRARSEAQIEKEKRFLTRISERYSIPTIQNLLQFLDWRTPHVCSS